MANEKNNSFCTVCGKGYYLCANCRGYKLAPWRIITDTSEHYKIHQILSGVSCGVYTKAEAQEKLKNVDISDIDTYKESVKEQIRDILDFGKEFAISDIEIDSQEKENLEFVTTKKTTRKKRLNETADTD